MIHNSPAVDLFQTRGAVDLFKVFKVTNMKQKRDKSSKYSQRFGSVTDSRQKEQMGDSDSAAKRSNQSRTNKRKRGRSKFDLDTFMIKQNENIQQAQQELKVLLLDKELNGKEIRRLNNIISAQRCRVLKRQRLDDAEKTINQLKQQFESLASIIEEELNDAEGKEIYAAIKAAIDAKNNENDPSTFND